MFDFDDVLAPTPQTEPSPTHTSHFSPQFQLSDDFSVSQRTFNGQQRPHAQPPQGRSQETQQARPAPDLIVPPKVPHLLSATSLGLPVYSATGFDALSILARVFNRPYPRIQLGPVDLTCSFVVVDTRRHDHPIIYCSPSFTKLTGYKEQEILGRNCRFLQSPIGQMESNQQRPDPTSHSAAAHFKKNLTADKECQAIITNYRKDGTPFNNLVTVIPIPGGVSGGAHEEGDIVFHVGFQVDMTEQPQAIMENVTRGSYLVEYPQQPEPGNAHRSHSGGYAASNRERNKSIALPPVLVSKEMKKIMASSTFLRSMPITTSTNFPISVSAGDRDAVAGTAQDPIFCGNHPLHMMLLELGPDFVHVVSLKGTFLYVAPSIRDVLGYEPDDLVGACISDIAHQDDVVPIMRELKENSSTGLGAPTEGSLLGKEPYINPRTVDLLFRARTKNGHFVWVETRGRLHSEPGKGRKAIILTGRAREMSHLTWETIAHAGGVAKCITVQKTDDDGEAQDVVVRQEFWGTLSNSGVLITVGSGIKDVLGWEPEEFEGLTIGKLMADTSSGIEFNVKRLGRIGVDDRDYEAAVASSTCRMKTKEGGSKVVVVNVFRGRRDPAVRHATAIPGGVHPAHLMCQVRLASAETYSLYPTPSNTPTPSSRTTYTSPPHYGSPGTIRVPSPPAPQQLPNPRHPDLKANVFQSLDTNRNTNWQYEIKQLKFRNQKLKDEIARLEGAMRTAKARQAQAQAQTASTGRYSAAYHPQAQYQNQAPYKQASQSSISARRANPVPLPSLSIDLSGLGYSSAAMPMRAQGPAPSLLLDPLRGPSVTRQAPVPIATQHSVLPPIPSHSHSSSQPLSTRHPLSGGAPARRAYVNTPSSYVQRVQNDVAARMAAQAQAQVGYSEHSRYAGQSQASGSGGGVHQSAGVKRSWGVMQGGGLVPQPRSGRR